MYPFFKNDDVVILTKQNSKPKLGQCVLLNKNIHRFISLKTIKGDRLLYPDKNSAHFHKIVLGRLIFKKSNTFFISNHEHFVLSKISLIISILSRLNREKQIGRKIIVIKIIILAFIHRALEHIFVKKIII